jgi:hypothetical protein
LTISHSGKMRSERTILENRNRETRPLDEKICSQFPLHQLDIEPASLCLHPLLET